jgi:uncharacterized protein (TIGR02594 family)
MKTFKDQLKSDDTRKVFLRVVTFYYSLLMAVVSTKSVFWNSEFSEYNMHIMFSLFVALIGANVSIAAAPIINKAIAGRRNGTKEVPETGGSNGTGGTRPLPNDAVSQSAITTRSTSQPVATNGGRNVLAVEAQKYVGLKEVAGAGDNPTIVGWFQELGWDSAYKMTADAIPWCSSLPNVLAKRLGLMRSGKPNAKSWLGVGRRISIEDARTTLQSGYKADFGIVAVFHRGWINPIESQGSGHVVIVESITSSNFTSIGGNESDSVKVTTYNLTDKMFIGFMLISK